MFQKILQKLLLSYFGAFVNGIDPNNLHVGIWSGDIKIHNVELNEEKINALLQSLRLPLKIRFSSLGSLRVIVPWKNLSSQPVDITITDVLLCLEVDSGCLVTDVKDFINGKKGLIQTYCKHLLEQSAVRIQTDGQPGYFNKMIGRIIDNIQLSMNNIHIRLEGGETNELNFRVDDHSEDDQPQSETEEEAIVFKSIHAAKPFACGFCLQSILAYTTDDKWQKTFIDRSKSGRSDIRKRIQLNDISVYWQEKNVISMNSLREYDRKFVMMETIGRKQRRLLTISGYLSFVRDLQPNKPLYHISMELQNLKVEMNYLQLKDIIQIAGTIADYRKSDRQFKKFEVSEAQQQKMQASFETEFVKLYDSQFRQLSEKMSDILLKTKRENLLLWTKIYMKSIIKRRKMEQMEKQKGKKGWFSFLGGGDSKVTESEEKQLENLIESLVEKEQQAVGRDGDSIWLALDLGILQGNISVLHTQVKKLAHFEYSGISFKMQTNQKYNNFVIDLEVGQFRLRYSQFQGKPEDIDNVLSKGKAKAQQHIDIFKPADPNCKVFKLGVTKKNKETRIKWLSKQIILRHDVQILIFLNELMELRASEQVKSAAWNRVMEIQKAQELAKQQKPVQKGSIYLEAEVYPVTLTISLTKRTQIMIGFGKVITQQTSQRESSGFIHGLYVIFRNIRDDEKFQDEYLMRSISCKATLLTKDQLVFTFDMENANIKLHSRHINHILQFARLQSQALKSSQEESLRQQNEAVAYKKGKSRLLTVFKTWKEYFTIFAGGYLQFYEQSAEKPEVTLYVKNCKIFKGQTPNILRLQSRYTNQLIQFKDQEQCNEWYAVLQQKIIDMSSNAQLFRRTDEEEDKKVTQVNPDNKLEHNRYRIRIVKITIELNIEQSPYKLELERLDVDLRESIYHFQRNIELAAVRLENMSRKADSQFRSLLINSLGKGENALTTPFQMRLEGRKKMHPAYTGEISLAVRTKQLKVNFDPGFYISLMRLFEPPAVPTINMSTSQRQNLVLQLVHNLLVSSTFETVERTILDSQAIEDKSVYMSFEKYRNRHSSISLLRLRMEVSCVRLNLIHHMTGCCNGSFETDNMVVDINKGKSFFFVELAVDRARLYDLSNYPKTVNTLAEEQKIVPYSLLEPTDKSKPSPFTLNFSTFQDLCFINRERLTTFIGMLIQNYTIRYQQQPFMRFIDYLTNQFLGFIMNPTSIDVYDKLPNKQFKFTTWVQATRKETQGMIKGLLMPFFPFMDIRLKDISVEFNSHPGMDCLKIFAEEVLILSKNELQQGRRIHLEPEQLARFKKKEYFNTLSANKYFEDRVLKGCFVNSFKINLNGAQLPQRSNVFSLAIDFQRLPNLQRVLLFPFLRQQRTLILNGEIPDLLVDCDKPYYNLILKCMMHNLTYDDERQQYFQHNFQHQKKMEFSDMSNIIKIERLSLKLKELDQEVRLPGFEFWFMRDVAMVKRMYVKSKGLKFLENDNVVVQGQSQTSYIFEFVFESEPNFDKKMTVDVRHLTACLQLPSYLRIGQYVIPEASCYPVTTVLSDLPAIVVNVHSKDTRIILAQNDNYCYFACGDLGYIWLRNRFTNHEILKQDHKVRNLDDYGVYNSNVIFVKGLQLAKCLASEMEVLSRMESRHIKENKDKYRFMSGPLSTFIRMNYKLKISPGLDIYYHTQMDFSIENSNFVISYADIMELMGGMGNKEEKKDNPPPPPANPPANPTAHLSKTTYTLIISQFQLQLLLSSPPAPVMLFQLGQCKTVVCQQAALTTVRSRISTAIQYWNLKVGKWQPVLQETQINIEVKTGQTKEFLVQCPFPIHIDLSIECIRLVKVLMSDISNKNSQSKSKGRPSIDKKPIQEQKDSIQRLSPYIIKNNLGCQLEVQMDEGSLRSILLSSQSMNYRVSGIEQQQAVQKANTPKRVKLTIRDDKVENQLPQMDLDKVKNKVLRIEEGSHQYDIIFVAEYLEITKCITISSAYLVHNQTQHPMIFSFAEGREILLEAGQKMPLPYNLNFAQTIFKLDFPHLGPVKENFKFESKRLIPNYQHYIVAESGNFNCNVEYEVDASTKLTNIIVSPLFVFRNSLPQRIELQVVFNSAGKTYSLNTIQLESQKEMGFHEFGSRDTVSIRARVKGFQFNQTCKIYDPLDKLYNLQKLEFSDYRGFTGFIRIKHSKRGRVKRYTFYADGFLINETPYHIYVYNNNNRLIPGQRIQDIEESNNKICLLDGVQQNLSLSLGDGSERYCPFSQLIPLSVLGTCGVDLIKQEKMFELALFIGVYCVDNVQDIYSTVVQIWPRYVMVNRCSKPLQLRQFSCNRIISIAEGERVPIEYEQKSKAQLIQLKLNDPDFEWMFSEAINFKDASRSVISFSTRGSHDHNLKKCFKLQVIKQFQYYYLLVDEIVDPADALIKIENNLKFVRLNLYQTVVDNLTPFWILAKGLQVREQSSMQYSYDYPNLSKKIKVELNFVGPLRSDFDDESIEIDMDKQNISKEYRTYNSETGRSYSFKIQLESVGPKSTLKFIEKSQELQEEEVIEQVSMHLAISFKQLGLSIIGYSDKRRCELLYLSMKEFGIILLEKRELRTIQVKIKTINIDNNCNHNTGNPVLLTPWKQQENQRSPRPFLVFVMEQGLKHRSITQIRSLRLCLQPTSIRVDDEFLEKIYGFVKMLGDNRNTTVQQVDVSTLVNETNVFAWESMDLKNLQSETFIQELQIAKISLIVSFSMRPQGSSSNLLIYHILKSVGVVLSKITDSRITFSHIVLRWRNLNQIKKELAEYYRSQFLKDLYRVLGSINLLGNPYSLGRYFVEGLIEVVDNPVQGFIKGPIEGTFGIVTGGVGLVRNICAGTFNSFELASDSLSSGLSSLSMDQMFIERRQKIKNQEARHIFSGLAYGTYSVYTGIELALTGLIRQPTQGYRQSGFGGGVAGGLKAISGLLTKPLSGIFQGISKTSQGIKNTALMFQDGPRTQRQRPPRVFYGQQAHYRNYAALHSQAISILETVSTKYLNLVVIAMEDFQEEIGMPKTLVISNDWLSLVDLEKKKLEWEFATRNLMAVRLTSGNITIETREGHEIVLPESMGLYEKLNWIVFINTDEESHNSQYEIVQ